MGGNKGFTNRAKSGKIAQQARIDRFVERQKTEGRVGRPSPPSKPSSRKPPR